MVTIREDEPKQFKIVDTVRGVRATIINLDKPGVKLKKPWSMTVFVQDKFAGTQQYKSLAAAKGQFRRNYWFHRMDPDWEVKE